MNPDEPDSPDHPSDPDDLVTEPSTPLTEGPGTMIGPYKLLEHIGEGGFGVVWAALQREPIKQRVALKIIKVGMDTKQVVARFEGERQALAMMNHPNIAKVLGAGSTDSGRPYFCLELIRGVPITEYCDENKLNTKERIELFIKVCHGIQHAHQKGIIHRDIKPTNILVERHDEKAVPKVIDFGIAKATQMEITEKTIYTKQQQFIGTPTYMSPEQAALSGLDIDTRSDIYSLGVLFYELLTGRTPFDAREMVKSGLDEMRKIILEREPPRPSAKLSSLKAEDRTTTAQQRSSVPLELRRLLRGDLDWIAMKCLEKDRTRRYETANGLAADLQRHLDNEPVVARPPSAASRFQKAWRRNRIAYSAGIAVVLALVIGIGVSVWQANIARQERVTADQAKRAALNSEAAKEEQRLAAESARERAEESEASARLNLYAADMNLVHHALLEGGLGRARQLLEHYQNVEPDFRGFEWHLFWEQSRGDQIRTIEGFDSMVNSVAFFPDDSGRFAVATANDRITIHHLDSALSQTLLIPAREEKRLRMHTMAVSWLPHQAIEST